jgi:hypothetical protein
MELGEHHLDLLDPVRSASVAYHLHECPHCAYEVAQLKGYLGDLASPDSSVNTEPPVHTALQKG